ncbi:MAG: hypothetical protein ACR2L8_17955, partial [Solirubrobacteraceae bacterium]
PERPALTTDDTAAGTDHTPALPADDTASRTDHTAVAADDAASPADETAPASRRETDTARSEPDQPSADASRKPYADLPKGRQDDHTPPGLSAGDPLASRESRS